MRLQKSQRLTQVLPVYSSRSIWGYRLWVPALASQAPGLICASLSYCNHQLCTAFQFFPLYVPFPLWASLYFTVVRSLDFIRNATGSHWRVWSRYYLIYIFKKPLCLLLCRQETGGAKSRGRKKQPRGWLSCPGEVSVIWTHSKKMEKIEFRIYSGGKKGKDFLMFKMMYEASTGKNSMIIFTTIFLRGAES